MCMRKTLTCSPYESHVLLLPLHQNTPDLIVGQKRDSSPLLLLLLSEVRVRQVRLVVNVGGEEAVATVAVVVALEISLERDKESPPSV